MIRQYLTGVNTVPDNGEWPRPDRSELTILDHQPLVPEGGETTLPEGDGSARPDSSSLQSIRRRRQRPSRALHPAAFLLDYLWVVALVVILSVTVDLLVNGLPGNCCYVVASINFCGPDGKNRRFHQN